MTVLRSTPAPVDHNSAKQASSTSLIIRPPLLPPVAKPPRRVAQRRSWKPRSVSAVISCTIAIAIHTALPDLVSWLRGFRGTGPGGGEVLPIQQARDCRNRGRKRSGRVPGGLELGSKRGEFPGRRYAQRHPRRSRPRKRSRARLRDAHSPDRARTRQLAHAEALTRR